MEKARRQLQQPHGLYVPPSYKSRGNWFAFFYFSHFVGGIMFRQTSIKSGYGPYNTKVRDRLGCVSEDNTALHQRPSLPNPPPPPPAGSGPPAGGGSTTLRSGTPLPVPLRQQDDEVVAHRPGSYCPPPSRRSRPPTCWSPPSLLSSSSTSSRPPSAKHGCRSRVSGTREAARRGVHALQGATVSRIPWNEA